MGYDGNNLEDLFRMISRMQHNCARKRLEECGIDPVCHPPILFVLRNSSEDMAASQKEIADRLGLSTPAVAVSIKRMEKAGVLHKVADETDLRRNLIKLTEKGRKIADEAQAVFEDVDRGMFTDLSQEECDQLKKLFVRIVANLEAMKENPEKYFDRKRPD